MDAGNLDIHIGDELFTYVVNKLDGYTADIYNSLMGSWPGFTIVMLYVSIMGFALLFNRFSAERGKEVGISILLLPVMGVVVGNFSEWLGQPVLDMVMGLSSLAATGGDNGDLTATHNIFQELDNGLSLLMSTVARIQPTGNVFTQAWVYLIVFASTVALSMSYMIMYVAFIALYLMAILGLYLMLMVGGIFVWLAVFKELRFLTWTWVKAIMNYVLWSFFLAAIAGFFLALIKGGIADLSTWDLTVDGAFPPEVVKLSVLCLLTSYFLTKAGELASALTGGSAMSSGAVSSVFGAAGGGTSGMAGKAAGAAGGAAGRLGGAAAGAARVGAGRAFSALKGLMK
jgi:type IV secretion system protein VirB6